MKFFKQLKNPFFKVGKTTGKWAKYTGLAMVGAAGVAATQMLPDYANVLAGALPFPANVILMAVLPALVAGAAGAAANFQKNYTVTPEKLAEFLAAADAGNTVKKYSFTQKELLDLISKAKRVAAKK